ncbi:MAG: sulfite exporter TauE/SafE family protein [Proteobacteria bacterium]|nr:sulfite exporter TauE/SafE family protein [Pseudomonadota bacterium]
MLLQALALVGVLLCGLAVGATSIGGVMVVPLLTGLLGLAPASAVAASSLAFAFSGAAALATRAPVAASAGMDADTDNDALPGWPLQLAALVGALLGALTLAWLPAGAVRMAVGVLALFSGLYTLFGARWRPRHDRLRPWMLAPLGLLVGCGSAWSGTGGPVLLLPLLTLLGRPLPPALAAAQRVQLPVALAASAVNLWAGRLDVALGCGLGVLVLAGWFAGRWVARRLPLAGLQRAVALALVATGAAYL